MCLRDHRLQEEDALRDLLLARLKEKGEELRALLEKMERHWGMEDGVYRFYHQSLKVYYVQELTQEAVELAATNQISVTPEALWRHRGTLMAGGMPTWRG